MSKTDVAADFLVSKAVEKSNSPEEFISHVGSIAKALLPRDLELATFLAGVHKGLTEAHQAAEVSKHLIGRHDQKKHDPKRKSHKGKGWSGPSHSRARHKDVKEGSPQQVAEGVGVGLGAWYGTGVGMTYAAANPMQRQYIRNVLNPTKVSQKNIQRAQNAGQKVAPGIQRVQGLFQQGTQAGQRLYQNTNFPWRAYRTMDASVVYPPNRAVAALKSGARVASAIR